MATVNKIAEGLLEMFDGASVLNSTRVSLISFLNDVKDAACNEMAADVACTLLDRIERFTSPYCSEKQAYAIAYAAHEYGIEL